MSLYRFNKVENGYYDCSYIEELVNVENLVNAIDVVFPGIRDICDTSSWVYYPDECDVVDDWGYSRHYLIPRRVQFKSKGILYDDSVFRIRRDAELERWKRWKRNLTRECIGNYGIV